MASRFTDAQKLLHHLLDRHESGAAQPLAYPDNDGFSSITEHDTLLRELAAAEGAGAIELQRGKGRRAGELRFVRLTRAEVLYLHLGRTPAAALSEGSLAAALDGMSLPPALADEVAKISEAWSRNRSWAGIAPNDGRSLREALLLAHAITDGRHEGSDYRTFSRRTTTDSKALERLEAPVVRLIRAVWTDFPSNASPRESLAAIGLEKVSPPLLLSGPVTLNGHPVASPLSFLGMSANDASGLGFTAPPAYLLVIENYTSFVRHVTEADPGRIGLTIYSGGYPSVGIQRALAAISAKLTSGTPFFHWSDIDPDGIWIFQTVERAVGLPLRPHLMDRSIAERHGHVAAGATSRPPKADASHISDLASYLSTPGAKHMEQEELDPVLPPIFPNG
jgi:hypothetical protein